MRFESGVTVACIARIERARRTARTAAAGAPTTRRANAATTIETAAKALETHAGKPEDRPLVLRNGELTSLDAGLVPQALRAKTRT